MWAISKQIKKKFILRTWIFKFPISNALYRAQTRHMCPKFTPFFQIVVAAIAIAGVRTEFAWYKQHSGNNDTAYVYRSTVVMNHTGR